MRIYSAAQLRQIDTRTIEEHDISSHQLMERAAQRCVEWLAAYCTFDTPIMIMCGPGNNGGDGFAITRLLLRQGFEAKAFFVRTKAPSEDCLANINLLLGDMPESVQILEQESYLTQIPEQAIIVDALLGTGTNRAVDGWMARTIKHINELPNPVISIDMPSGLIADAVLATDALVVKAEHTLTFHSYKRVMLHPEGGKFCGEVHVLNIGLSHTAMDTMHSYLQIVDEEMARSIYKPRERFTHKGTHGTALIAGGSKGMVGAVTLGARAAGRAGAGKVRALVPECGYEVLQVAVPEALCQTSGQDHIEDLASALEADGAGIGAGMEVNEQTMEAMERLLKQQRKPLILDAGALNILGQKKELLHQLPPNTILTPHPKEFERMFGKTEDSIRRADLARAMAMRYNIIIVLKDRYTFTASPEGSCYYNMAGHAGLATGGSGDTLLGIITGLLSAKYTPLHAALLGVWLHSAAAEEVLSSQSAESMVAGDIAEGLGAAFKRLAGR